MALGWTRALITHLSLRCLLWEPFRLSAVLQGSAVMRRPVLRTQGHLFCVQCTPSFKKTTTKKTASTPRYPIIKKRKKKKNMPPNHTTPDACTKCFLKGYGQRLDKRNFRLFSLNFYCWFSMPPKHVVFASVRLLFEVRKCLWCGHHAVQGHNLRTKAMTVTVQLAVLIELRGGNQNTR